MDVESAIRGRRSARKYKPEPVAEKTVREILDEGRWAPSWANTQPWSIYVVSGEALEKLKAANRKKAQAGEPSTPDIRMPRAEWPIYMRERTMRLRQQMSATLSAAKDNSEVTPGLTASIGDLFGAPCLLLFCIAKSLIPEYACFDTDLIVQTVCLAAHARGLGTCIMANVVRHADVLREQLPGAGDKCFVVGVALGYPEWESPVNRFERDRADLDELVTWVSQGVVVKPA
jgi:nitroreductase